MNNKGFTLIEVLASLVIFTIASLVISRFVGNTLAISNECIDKVKNAYDYIIQEGAIK